MQNKVTNFPMPEHLRSSISSDDQDVRNTIRAMSKTIKKTLLAEDGNIRSMYLNIEGETGIRHSLNIHGKFAGTGWKTTIILSKNDDDNMISFEVKLPRGRQSYRTDILASLVTEDVVREYAQHALVQLLKKNNREEVLTQLA